MIINHLATGALVKKIAIGSLFLQKIDDKKHNSAGFVKNYIGKFCGLVVVALRYAPLQLSLLTFLFSGAIFFSHSVYADEEQHWIPLERHFGGTFHVQATLAGSVSESFLMDTGASLLTINQGTYRALNQQGELVYSRTIGLRSAMGSIQKVNVYHLSRLTVGERCELQDVEVAVKNGGKNILGMNVLTQFAPFGVSLEPAQLALSNCTSSLIANHRE